MWGALWVTQRASVEQPELHEHARATIHSCLETELGALTGGARGQARRHVAPDHLAGQFAWVGVAG